MKGVACGALWMALLWAASAHAHKPSDSYLSLRVTSDSAQLSGQWDIALRDLEHAIGIDMDRDGQITWGELRSRQAAVAQYAFARLGIERDGRDGREACPIAIEQLLTDNHVDGAYAVLRFRATCAAIPEQIAISYSLLFDLDPNHRGLLNLRTPGGTQAFVLSQDKPRLNVALNTVQRWTQVRSFLEEGVWHILHGYDHVLFLCTLLLPAVVLFRNGSWQPRSSLREAMLDIVKVVTAFTLAHSLTLSIAALGWLTLPSRWVESTIAFTVVLGALNNLFPIVTERRWIVAFVFGLIHGFGFASVLSDLGLERGNLAVALFGFNAGIELGQLAIVVVLVPLAYWMRASVVYRRIVMPGGAVAIGIVAAYWFVTRAFDISVSGS